MPLLPFGEYKPDIADYETSSTKNIVNVVPRNDGYGPFPGSANFTNSLPGPCRGGFYALNPDGTVTIFAGTATKLYVLNNTNFSWTDVSLGFGTYSALSSNANWTFVQTGNLVFACQANVPLQVFTLESSSNFSNALGSPPQAAYINIVGRFIVLSGLLSSPYRIQWSGLNNFNASTSWDNITLGSNFQDFPDGGIVRGIGGGETGIVFQDQATRTMSYIPGSPLIFQIERLSQDKGLLAPYSIIRAGENIFYYAGQGFHMIPPGGTPVPIGRERVDRTFALDLDGSNLQLFIGASHPRTSRVYWAYKSVNGFAGVYDKIIGYDYVLDRWFTASVQGQYLLGISQPGVTLDGLDVAYPSLDAMTISLDSFPTAVQPQLAHFDGTNTLGMFNGAALQATVESGEQGTDGTRLRVRGFRVVTDAPSVLGAIDYRELTSNAPIRSASVARSARTGRCDISRSTRYVRYLASIPAGSSWNFAAGVEADTVSEGMI